MPGRSGFLLSNVVPQAGISYDLTRFSYVGSAGSAANALWLHRRTGITSLAELKRAKKEIAIGALNGALGERHRAAGACVLRRLAVEGRHRLSRLQ